MIDINKYQIEEFLHRSGYLFKKQNRKTRLCSKIMTAIAMFYHYHTVIKTI